MRFGIFLLVFCLMAIGGVRQANAQTNVLHPFAPWMTLEDDEPDKATLPEPKPAPMHSEKAMATPAAPVLTPQDTARVVEQLYADKDAAIAPPSPLEDAYSRRAGEPLRQFGYDQFTPPAKTKDQPDTQPAGGVQDDFVLNAGDKLRVTFRGQRQDSKLYTVGSNGQLVIDDLPPIAAAGRTIKQLRDDLQAQVDTQHNTDVFLSLDEVKQITVLVAGNVAKPGPQTLTVFNTIFDALSRAGGVEKTGSLRQLTLVHDGKARTVDLYALFVHPTGAALALQDGDRLVVPPIGATAAVSGGVKRPGIYELPGKAAHLSRDALLGLAGGPLLPGANRLIKMSLSGGQDNVSDVTEDRTAGFGDGGILRVEAATPAPAGDVTLSGETRQPGPYQLGHAGTLSSLLGNEIKLGANVYPLIGVIKRRDTDQLSPTLVDFSPLAVLHGAADAPLQENDVVYLFSRTQISALQKSAKADGKKPAEETAVVGEEEAATAPLDPDILSFLRERCAFVRGAVRNEGCWPVAPGATLDAVIAAAGGFTYEASNATIEVQSRLAGEGHQINGRSGMRRITVNYETDDPARIAIGPGDSVRVKQKFQRAEDRSVLVLGEVANPGRYDLMPQDHLSDLIARAGGLTLEAYPPGAIFSRESERAAERLRFRQQAQELELGLAAALRGQKKARDDDSAVSQGQVDAAQELIDELKHADAVGRLTVEANTDVLTAHPEDDILLEAGDRIYIPRRPLTVRVAGEVEAPAALAFRKEKGPNDYIREAGGFTYNADDGRAFVVFPDGSAKPLAVSSWSHSADFIPPGSTIIVPRDPKPFDFLETAKDVSQILSNLAITGIFIHDVKNGGY